LAKIYPEYRDEVRKKVVSAAHEVFHCKGYRDATMSDIATALGVTKPTIYHYFGGKEEIFAAVAEYERKLLESIIMDVFRDRDFITGVEVFFDTIMTKYLEKIGPESMGMATKDVKLQEIINRDREAFLAIIERFLSQRQGTGEIRSDADPRTLACALDALFHGLLIYIMQGMEINAVKKVWVESVRGLTQAS
jgi:AcrR family transcriptional regulator